MKYIELKLEFPCESYSVTKTVSYQFDDSVSFSKFETQFTDAFKKSADEIENLVSLISKEAEEQ